MRPKTYDLAVATVRGPRFGGRTQAEYPFFRLPGCTAEKCLTVFTLVADRRDGLTHELMWTLFDLFPDDGTARGTAAEPPYPGDPVYVVAIPDDKGDKGRRTPPDLVTVVTRAPAPPDSASWQLPPQRAWLSARTLVETGVEFDNLFDLLACGSI